MATVAAMIVSQNELSVMALKATIGAGRPSGLAQDAASAATRLEAAGLPGARVLLTLLQQSDGQDVSGMTPDVGADIWTAPANLTCPLVAGTYLSDVGALPSEVRVSNVVSPALLAVLAGRCGAVSAHWDKCTLAVVKQGYRVVGNIAGEHPVDVEIKPGQEDAAATHRTSLSAVDIDDEIWEALSGFALRTYVPATEASRLSGAGAGLTDND